MPDQPKLPEWRAEQEERMRQKFVPCVLYPTVEEWAKAGFPPPDTPEGER